MPCWMAAPLPPPTATTTTTKLGAASGGVIRRQLVEEEHLVADLAAFGKALLGHRSLVSVPVTGGEHIQTSDPLQQLRILGALTSVVALNACPKLRGRAGGACSAACVPVSFMGRALGVLHATGPEGVPPTAEQITQLTTLATQAGARIGTVRAFEKTQLQASTDGLTGLVNRRTFESQVRGLINEKRVFALAVADLDKFKAINDTHGHEAGDKALRLFAQVAHDALREDDILARWGGEEFVFAFPDLERHQAVRVLDRLRERLTEGQPGNAPRFTASFGVTDSDAAEGLEEMLHIADGGLYVSKQSGRDQVTIGENDPNSPVRAATHGPQNGSPLPRVRRRGTRPLLHDAGDEEDPRATGLEIR
jgi:diguanylate cyclase (GGDEF)-like protein